MNLKSRIGRLEATAGNGREPVIIVIRPIRPGDLDPPLTHLRIDDGQVFTRQPGEAREDFEHRAARAAGWPARAVQLIGTGAE